MKQLSTSGDSASWNASLVGQLSFIRKQLRFPANRRTLTPLIAIALSSIGLSLLVLPTLFRKSATGGLHPLWWLVSLLLLPTIVAAVRYVRNLRFIAVPAYPSQADNMRLVESFFRTYAFAYGRHPEAPEVYQMLSRNVGGKRALREVLIFVADPGRILLNSHFVGEGFGLPVSSGHSRRMARMLIQFLNEQQPNEKTTELYRPF
ncbi:MAG: hypothetical protein EOP52_11880 [Sphingobacteriales bacterium]|nr:MAG: hypothetical protein EOP52_11880 [Sphingobacteriales bacterium]